MLSAVSDANSGKTKRENRLANIELDFMSNFLYTNKKHVPKTTIITSVPRTKLMPLKYIFRAMPGLIERITVLIPNEIKINPRNTIRLTTAIQFFCSNNPTKNPAAKMNKTQKGKNTGSIRKNTPPCTGRSGIT